MTVGTVTAQLLYEIGGPRYLSPDAVARFDTIGRWRRTAADRVRISGDQGRTTATDLEGDGQPRRRMAELHDAGHHRGQVEEKAPWPRRGVGRHSRWARTASPRRRKICRVTSAAAAWPSCASPCAGDDERAVGRAFSGAVVETSLSSYPGSFYTSAPSGAAGGGAILAHHHPAPTTSRPALPATA